MSKNKKILIAVLTILLLISILFIILTALKEKHDNEAVPVINLIGNENIELKLNEEYQENGATASLGEEDITTKIQKTGEVDTTKVGKYEITYVVSNSRNKNQVQVKRIINVIDNIQPEIQLNGEAEISIYAGSEYKEQGALATDNYDGDITESIVISGEVDTKKAGTYTVKYNVQDSSANSSEITRSVTVKEPEVDKGIPILMYHFFYDKNVSNGIDRNWIEVSVFEEQMKYLAENNYYFPSWQEIMDYVDGKITLPSKSVVITADDGDPTFFELAVPIIKKYNIKATSFVIASYYAWDAVKYESENVTIQSHTYDMHLYAENGRGVFTTKSYQEALEDIKKSKEDLGGDSVIAFAYPFGHYNQQCKEVLKEAGIQVALKSKGGRVYKGMDKLELPRFWLHSGIDMATFKSLVK